MYETLGRYRSDETNSSVVSLEQQFKTLIII